MPTPDPLSIPKVPMPDPRQFANDLIEAVVASTNSNKKNSTSDLNEQGLIKALIVVANQSWRMGSALIDVETTEPKANLAPQDLRKLSNALDAIRECIQELGIKVIDRTGEAFDSGLPDQVVTEEPQEAISKERIIRTIRPTIMWNQTMVQRGEIDIAVPTSKK
jgi:hypothetical protein